MMAKWNGVSKNWWLYGLLLVSLGVNVFQWQDRKTSNSNRDELRVFVDDVIDGDTFVTAQDQRIRLIRLDAPEEKYCMGKEAKERLAALVKGKEVVLKEAVGDNFGRLVALVYVGSQLVNEVLLEEGLVRYMGGPTSERERLEAAAKLAREEKRGIYGVCYQYENPDKKECSIKGNIDKNSGRKIYHFFGCSGYTRVAVETDFGEEWFCSEKEAETAGYVKAETCYGRKFEK